MIAVEDLKSMDYRQAWAIQEAIHAEVADGGPERLLLVEHSDVITFGRRPPALEHLLASKDWLQGIGIQVVESDRGGDVTFHGPGQLVVYPIIRLNTHGLSVGGYVRMLEHSVIAALNEMGIAAHRKDGAVGIWTDDQGKEAKICAIGVRIRRGVSMHGLALNVRTDLSRFNLIVPCGLRGSRVTSLEKLLAEKTPSMAEVKTTVVSALQNALAIKEKQIV
jgi:lipoyl(octanoyl) transferase